MPVLRQSDDGHIRIFTLDRPDARNALDRQLRDELARALDGAEADPTVRAVVLTGSGTTFCAGMDLAELEPLLDNGFEEHLEDSRNLGELFMRLYSFPLPTVAAINGHAVAGGAGLATLCDMSVISEDAKLGYTEARIGFVAALVGVFLSRMAGERAARELLLGARLLSAGEVVARGLANEARPSAEVLPRAIELARTMADNAPNALAASKSLLVESSGIPLADALSLAAGYNAAAREGEELREGIRAFLEKRSPAWRS